MGVMIFNVETGNGALSKVVLHIYIATSVMHKTFTSKCWLKSWKMWNFDGKGSMIYTSSHFLSMTCSFIFRQLMAGSCWKKFITGIIVLRIITEF